MADIELTGGAYVSSTAIELVTDSDPGTIVGYLPSADIDIIDEPYLSSTDINLQAPAVAGQSGYFPSADIELIDEPYLSSTDIRLVISNEPVEPPEPPEPTLSTLIISVTGVRWSVARKVDSGINIRYGVTNKLSSQFELSYDRQGTLDRTISLVSQRDLLNIDVNYGSKNTPLANQISVVSLIGASSRLNAVDTHYKLNSVRQFFQVDTAYNTPYIRPHLRDVSITGLYNAVRLNGVERQIKLIPTNVGYISSSSLQLNSKAYISTLNIDIESQEGVDFIPDGFIKAPLQPTGVMFKVPFGEATVRIDKSQTFAWGYGLNNFVIGGVTTIPSNPVEVIPPEPDPPIVHINYEVYRIVNTVNIKLIPSGEFINFDNFTITRDIESFAWTANFDVLDRASHNLIKPLGRSLKNVEIDINGTKFVVFIGKSSTSQRSSSNGVVTSVYSTTGWSNIKALSNPYIRKRSFTDPISRTAAQASINELTGTGFELEWQTVDWSIPIGVHSYQNKTPIGAILTIVNAAGGVIEPYTDENKFKVKPYYPISPWDWDRETTAVNREMNESQFFSIDTETVPKENPDGVFVYGEEKGVGVRAVRAGKPGTDLLPDVLDKYITTTIVGQERARQEVAKNSFIEKIPMTTYVDEHGIIMPQELIEFTDQEGEKWRGMVLQTSVACQRIGTALAQQITVARFFDD